MNQLPWKQAKRLKLLRDLGHGLEPRASILDLGCGNGDGVQSYLIHGFDAFGCDFSFKEGEHVESLVRDRRLRKIESANYRLPFDAGEFDFVYSEQVFEHVRDYDATLGEIRRVLKPGGVSLHVFPTRYQFIEPHVYIPLATVFRWYPWILLWTTLGVRQAGQEGVSAREAARNEIEYLRTSTNYLTTRQLRSYINRHFAAEHRFCEREALRHSTLERLYAVLSRMPLAGWFLSTFASRVLFLRKSSGGRTEAARPTWSEHAPPPRL